jgi:hypothetical protein
MLIVSLVLAGDSPIWAAFLWLQLLLYGMVFANVRGWLDPLKKFALVRKPVSLVTYFVLGQLGTLLGVFDFLRGKKIDRWVPAQG